MSTFIVNGGKPLYGSVRVGGAKNASYKLMLAALLADTPSRILNFSHISDVQLVASLINTLGAKAMQVGDRTYMIDPTHLSADEIDPSSGEASRASTLFIPALLAKFGRAVVPFPGGDKIGARPLDRHFDGLIALGAKVEMKENKIIVTAEKLRGATYRFKKSTHTGTETLLMAAVKAEGTTILENSALETEIDDLIAFLNSMGAKITRKPDRIIEIVGVPHLHGAIHKIMPDHNQVVSFACAALATKGDVIVENARASDIESFLEKLEAVGAGYDVGEYGVRFYYKQPLRATDVATGVHPGFKTDWQPLWVTMMTQAEGVSVLHETVTESRFQYVESLNAMGADIELFNPVVEHPDELYNFNLDVVKPGTLHAARITGPTQLHGGEFTVKDLRHGATLMIAGLIAEGKTILHDQQEHIDRGYETLEEVFQALGATIRRE
jgi:UDP-N-acetylglucosamine 1-carboxyvinyltransferase